MRIQNNIMALNAHRQYNINQSGIAKSTEKLSSGFRINRAGDDAAGLAISEKMRAQIRGLTMASKNSQDAISLVQTAEGALQETHNILQRMRELAVQSSSDSNETTIDRGALQQEYQNLLDEINDISTTTRFNDQNLLDGTFQKMLHTANTTATTLSNVNALSVTRASAGEYKMSVASTPASPSTVSPGTACNVFDQDTIAMADKADKVASVTFTGLETSAHDGNTYTLKVTGSDTANMTFQLLDSNGDIVSTAQNVNTSEWKAGVDNAAGNVVNFSGVGSLTFTLEDDQAISNVTDLDSMSGSTMTFKATGTGKQFAVTMDAFADISTIGDELTANLDKGALTVAYVPGNMTVQGNASAEEPVYTMEAVLGEKGGLTVNVYDADKNLVKTASGSVLGIAGSETKTINLGDYGSVTLNNTGTDTTALAKAEPAEYGSAHPGYLTGSATEAGTINAGDFSNVATDTSASTTSGTDFTFTLSGSGVTIASNSIKYASGDNLDAGSVSLAIDAGAKGKYTLDVDVSGMDTTAAITAINNAISGFTATVTETTPAVLAGAFASTTATSAASTAVETPIELVGGKAQEATMASRASMTLTINGESVTLHKGDTYANFADQGISFSFDALSDEDILNGNYFGGSEVTIAVNGTQGKSLIIQSGANQGDELAINVDRISTETLGLSYSNISTHEAASRAITEVNNAINQVSTQRAALGALQNRLDHKIANLDTSAENLTAAEARIRDVDMAKEMTNFTKNNILFQASTAMLAQANAAPQGVLQLLG